MHDTNPKVALEAIYAFGTLAPEVAGSDRPALLRASAPELASMLGVPDTDARLAALQVIARVYERRADDPAVDETLGDAVVSSLNEKSTDLKLAAMRALGAMRYGRSARGLTDLFTYYKRGPMAESALDALARVGGPGTTDLFLAQLPSGNVVLEKIAIEGLARFGDPSKASDIDKAAGHDRSDALILASAFFSAAQAKGSIDSIVDALTRDRLHDQAFGYLVELAPGRARLFTQGSQDPDAQVRADVADALGVSGDRSAIAMVEAMKQDQDPRVAHAAERAAARLRSGR
jgi:HEAT repeat protein